MWKRNDNIFNESFDETANAIFDKMYSVLCKYNLKACNISCFGSHSLSFNYGKIIPSITILNLQIYKLCKGAVTVVP
jgi:hypothetical protein